jgi:hypothetical protein
MDAAAAVHVRTFWLPVTETILITTATRVRPAVG